MVMNKKHHLYVLIACEESQAECAAWRALGCSAFSCDIQPCRKSGNPAWHILGDVTPYLQGKTQFTTMSGDTHNVPGWDLIIAHPSFTYLTKVGSPWLYKNPDHYVHLGNGLLYVNEERYKLMSNARAFFYKCLDARAHYVAVENPIPMRIAQLPPADTYVDPSWFGVKYTKKTLYWLRNLPPLFATVDFPGARCYVTASRGKYRSRTFTQLADAVAKQWYEFICSDINNGNYSPASSANALQA